MQLLKQKRLNLSLALWIVTAALFLLAVVPSLPKYMVVGHDVLYHSTRLLNIAEEMKHGNLFPQIYTYALDGMGYGAPLFYSDLFIYPFAALNAAGLSIQWTFKLLQTALLALSFVSMYFTSRKLFGDRLQAQVTALAYSFSFYALLDVYYRAAIGECFTFIFLPIVYHSYHRITHGREDQWWLLALSMTGILLAHTLSVILAALFLVVLILFDFRFWLKNLSKVRFMAYAALLCVGLSCYFWAPMLEQLTSLSFRLDLDVNNTHGRFLSNMFSPLRLLSSPIITSALRSDLPISTPRLMGTFTYAAVAVALVACWRAKKRGACLLLAASMVFVWLSGRYSPTQLLSSTPLATLQFPWRILLPAALMLALFIGAGFAAIKKNLWRCIMIGALALSAVTAIWVSFPSDQYAGMARRAEKYGYTFETFNDFHLNLNEVSDGQYLPYDLEYVMENGLYAYYPPTFDAAASDESVRFALSRDEDNHLLVGFSGNPGGATIDVPVILYVGYEAALTDGTPLGVSCGDSGMVRIHLGDAPSGTAVLRYGGTETQTLSMAVTVMSLTFFALLIMGRRGRFSGD